MLNDQEYGGLLERQRNYFKQGNTRNLDFRIAQLITLKRIIKASENDLLEALRLDLGKCSVEGYVTEINILLHEIDYMIKKIRCFSRPTRVKTSLIYPGARSTIYSEPRGVVLIIAPWNYPVLLLLTPLVGAMAAGNCAVLKPSEFAPNVSKLMAKIISENFSGEYITLIEGDSEAAQRLLQDKFDYIFFTGGLRVGKMIMQAAAQHITPVTLELGGKSPCIVDRDIHLDITARRIVWGKFINAGQTCIAPDYLLVHKDIRNELLNKITEIIRDFYGSCSIESKHYSRIVNDRHFMRLTGLLEEGNIIIGGETNREERYIAPTVIVDVPLSGQLMQEEIFGPILPVFEYETLEEVVDIVNDRPKPLALYFFSHNREKQDFILKASQSGGVCINDTLIHTSSCELPFGGVGESGIGSYHGRASFDTFSHRKSVMRNTFRIDMEMKYPPYKLSFKNLKRLMKFM